MHPPDYCDEEGNALHVCRIRSGEGEMLHGFQECIGARASSMHSTFLSFIFYLLSYLCSPDAAPAVVKFSS